MKKIIIYFIILSTSLLTGCFNYKDIDKIIFTTSVIVDVDEDGMPIVYEEAFKPARGGNGSSGKGSRILFKGTGKTLFETFRDINLSSSYKINYTQCRGIIFTSKAAEKGLDNFIDVFDRGQEFVIRSDIVIYRGDPEKLIKTKLKEQDYIGLFIHDLIYNTVASSKGTILSLNDFLNKSYSKNNACVIPMIELKKDQLEDKVSIGDGAIIKDYKMVGQLRAVETESYNFIVDRIKGGTLEIPNPNCPSKFVTLEILKSKTDTKVYYDGKTVHVKKIINTKTSITEAQKALSFDAKTLNQLSKNAEANIKKFCIQLFEENKKMGLDIFDIGDSFNKAYPREKIEGNIIYKTELEIDSHVFIEGSSDISSFK
ncbi:Ger(x)C family spore germination protein [Clostridium sp. PL3]|uniref:Ger(X)C family spore germination protein n=1 Tax=Clostridium thailandense TaxID=2794346 RepID=A0A949U1A2_9CLOT|nr:Ger(x)C family spore germination protein [Clostridium thailandense]MBV7275530.1 Ger(x)C family spore germination protein [Clostridium thailandense]